jgi:serine/threonine protein kinase/predicted ATPase/DNA-binding SARP family transcriptional activator
VAELALYLLGLPRIELAGEEVRIGRRKALALLAYLAITGQSHTRDLLATLLWPEHDQSRARNSLRAALVSLRKALGEGWLGADRESVGLSQGAGFRLDVAEFQNQLAARQAHGHPPDEACPACLPLLAGAAELYRGDFMAGFTLPDSPAFDEWQYYQSESLRGELAGALERLSQGHATQGEFERAIAHARRWMSLDPLNEPAHRLLMQLYAWSGQRAAAVEQYAACQRILAEELGAPPTEETTALYERILAGEVEIPTSRARTIGGYELRERIGSGGFGEVYRAYQPSVTRDVAVKVILPQYANHPEFVRRFEAEAQLVARLEHPHIVPLHDYWRGGEGAYLVMRWLPGGNLHDALQRGPWRPEAAAELLDQIAGALDTAHRQGVVHRDVKPENILLDRDGNAYLSDFGIAKDLAHAAAATDPEAVPGSLWYISPEQAQSQAVTPQSDLYSLGIVMHQVLTGEHPFSDLTPPDQLIKRLTEPLPSLCERRPDLPQGLEEVIRRATAHEPGERYPDVPAFARAFRAALSGIAEAAARPSSTRTHNLPAQLTPFVGRETLLAEIADRLTDPACRLLSLVGPGGSGKTRLALEAAAAQLDNYPHGVFFVSLAPLESAEAIVSTIAKAVGFTFYAEAGTDGVDRAQGQLLRYLSEKQMLLLMDNYEHLPDGVGVVSNVLQAAPGVKVLATSRARLNLGGEHLLPVPGMDVPDAQTVEQSARSARQALLHCVLDFGDALQSSAVKLFVQSARRAQPSFELVADNLADVVHICRLVAGMPLGILLAAGWLEMLTPKEIVVQLGGEIGSSFDFLETNLRDAPARQRSMRAVFDHSWRLLTEREREVFRKLSAFRGGFTAHAGEQVAGATLLELRGLVHKSLLGRERTGRYEIHELLRQYAAEKLHRAERLHRAVELGAVLAEGMTTRDRHSAYFAGFLQQREEQLLGEERKRALEEIETEIDNVGAAWGWAVAQGKIDEIDRSLDSLAGFYRARGWFQEGEEAFSRAAQRIAGAQYGIGDHTTMMVLGKALLQQGRFNDALGFVDRASELLGQSLAIFGDLGARRETAYALRYLGDVAFWKGKGEDLYQDALAISEELGDQRGIALSLWGLSMVANYKGEYRSAKQSLQQSLAIFTQIGNVIGVVDSLNRLGWTNWLLGEYQAAKQLHERSLALCRESGDRFRTARALGDLGIDACGLQEYAEANQYWHESLAIYQEAGNLWGMADVLGDMGELANFVGEYSEAQHFARESLALREKIGSAYGVIWSSQVLGNALCGLGDLQGAQTYLCRSLATAVKSHGRFYIPLIVGGVAQLLAAKGGEERALELLALVFHHPKSCQWAKDRAAPLVAQLEGELPRAGPGRDRGEAVG